MHWTADVDVKLFIRLSEEIGVLSDSEWALDTNVVDETVELGVFVVDLLDKGRDVGYFA